MATDKTDLLNDPNEYASKNKTDIFDKNLYQTLLVGPSFVARPITHLLLNKLKLKRSDNPRRKIRIVTRSPEQNENLEVEDFSVEEEVQDFETSTIHVFSLMICWTQSEISGSIFTRGTHALCDVYYLTQSYFDLPERTIRNISNIIILFQQTWKDVEHIYRDIAGFDVSICLMTSGRIYAGRHGQNRTTL